MYPNRTWQIGNLKTKDIATNVISVIIITILLIFNLPLLQAQERQDPPLEEIVVRGRKYAEIVAISEKRNNHNIVEAMSVDELGQLPDNNLGESLGRIPGVATVLDEGVGRYVTVRGLNPDFVSVSVDGATFSSAARTWEYSGRKANMEAVTADFIGKIQVYKSVSADMDGESIGGTINMVSKSAFDLKQGQSSYLYLDGSSGKNSSDDAPFSKNDSNSRYQGSFLGRLGDKFGVVLTASQKREEKDVIKQDIHYWNGGIELPSGAIAPEGLWDTLIHEEGEKDGLSLKLEYQASENVYGYVSVVEFSEDQIWNNGAQRLWNSGSYDEANAQINGWASVITHKLSQFGTEGDTNALGFNWNFLDNHTLSFNLTNSSSESYLHEPRAEWVGSWGQLNGTYTTAGRTYRFDLDQAGDELWVDTSTYFFNQVRDLTTTTEETVDTVKVDWSYNLDGRNGSWGYKAGIKFGEKDFDYREVYVRADKYQGAEHFQNLIDVYDYQPPSSSNPLLFGDVPTLVTTINNNFGSITDFALSEFSRIRSLYAKGHDFDVEETVDATYALVNYRTYLLNNAVNLKFGLRYESTDWSGSNRLDAEEDGEMIAHGGDYSHVLPSVGVTYDIRDDVRLRAAYSKTLGRPGVSNYAAFESSPNAITGVFSRSNPDLEPRESDNTDLSFEYYFGGGNNLLSLGLFRKEIANEIYDQQMPYQYDNGVDLIDSFFLQPANSGKGKVDGMEFNFVMTSVDFLPDSLQGLGLSFNWTRQDSRLDIVDAQGQVSRRLDRIPESPEKMYNFALTFDDLGVDARLAYQYQGEQTLLLAGGEEATTLDDLVREAGSRVDLHVGFDITNNVNVYVDIWNLTEEETQDRGFAYWDEKTVYGRATWAGLKVIW